VDDAAARAELVDWLSTWLIRVAFFAAAVGFAGAMFTRCKITNQRATPNTPRHKCCAAWFESASNICQFGTVVIAIAGGLLASNKLSHDRALRAQAREEKARLANELAEEQRARLQRDISPTDSAQMLSVLNEFPGTSIDLMIAFTDLETLRFAGRVAQLFRSSNWVVTVSCGRFVHVNGMIIEFKPQYIASNHVELAAWEIVGKFREVRPDLAISEPRPWSDIAFKPTDPSPDCLASPTVPWDGGKLPDSMIRLIIGSK
jgi:hypothetical protein